jgi:hypothetical protein
MRRAALFLVLSAASSSDAQADEKIGATPSPFDGVWQTEGLVGAAPFAVGQRPAGTPYGYHVEAHFSVEHAQGHRVEGRPCNVVWTRDGS